MEKMKGSYLIHHHRTDIVPGTKFKHVKVIKPILQGPRFFDQDKV